jgi:hypothetical protein
MGMLRIISNRGDDRLHWNEQFDAQTSQIIMVPRVVGG